MMTARLTLVPSGGVLVLAAVLAGCQPHAGPQTGQELPVAVVAKPVVRQFTDYVDFTGRTDAVYSTDIRARVTGYLVGMPFKEGAEVKTGDVLFEIDPRPYQAAYDKSKSDVNLLEAKLTLAKADNARAKK